MRRPRFRRPGARSSRRAPGALECRWEPSRDCGAGTAALSQKWWQTIRSSSPLSSACGLVSPVWVDEIVGYVNEDELLGTAWGLLPADDENERDWLRRCRGVFDRRLGMVRSQELLVPQVAYGFFPVNSDGRELIVWADDDRTEERAAAPVPSPAPRAVSVCRRLLQAGRQRRIMQRFRW